jgi:hypothetical protein
MLVNLFIVPVAERQAETVSGHRPTVHVDVPTRWATNYLAQRHPKLLHKSAGQGLNLISSVGQASVVRQHLKDEGSW